MTTGRAITIALAVLAAVTAPIADEPAAAASDNLYLKGDSEPSGSMAPTPPPGGALPNFDPGRDSFPGLLIQKGGGSGQTDPTKYQEWRFDASNKTLSVKSFRIWAAPKDFDEDKTVRFAAYVMECKPSCSVLDSASAKIEEEEGSDWKAIDLPLTVPARSFASGSHLVVKVTVEENSDDDMWFAYGTSSFDAHLQVQFQSSPSTTSTTSPTTSTTSTTTPGPTSSLGPTAASEGPATTSTTTDPRPTTTPTPTTTIVGSALSASTTTTTSVTSTTVPATATPELADSAIATRSLESTGSGGQKRFELRPVELAASGDPEAAVDDEFTPSARLRPEEGLAVAFATVAENISLYWQAALGTGGVASVLLWIGLANRASDPEADDQTASDPE
jgi:hypothetical protein